ncbi:UDP-N-acetylmuramoyl-L-alanine--D-glutamate ligase [bacterium]|nr:UDP-N-acetylmuramoyl-L-alanine--D-glutamate ligase [bacterium]
MRVAIMGLAKSGLAAANLALKLGFEVSVSDNCQSHGRTVEPSAAMLEKARDLRSRGAYVEIGRHSRAFLEGADILILSPGVSEDNEAVRWAQEAGIEAVGEVEFAVRYCKGKVVAITGTNGKTTTTSLISHILEQAGIPHVTAGNIGVPLSEYALETTDEHVLVLEMSSFQLESIKEFSPAVSVWLNLTPDHLDRYRDIEAYRSAKENIFRHQRPGSTAIVWHQEKKNEQNLISAFKLHPVWVDETGSDEEIANADRAVLRDGLFTLSLNGESFECGAPKEMLLKGRHNHINLLCAMAAAKVLGVDEKTIREACMTFKGLSHRIETVARINDTVFVDDSKGTNPEATVEAVMAFDYPEALILGGYDKGSDYGMLIPYMKGKVSHVILIGATTEKFQMIFGGEFPTVQAKTMKDAVQKGYELMKEGGTVLLSPACASFDMYKSYEERGDDFAELSRKLSQELTK